MDRALAQTTDAGFVYAALPEPWWEAWVQWQADRAMTDCWLWMGSCLAPGWALDKIPVVDGDVWLCLLAPGHEGDCGWAHLSSHDTQPVPTSEGVAGAFDA